ncbi:MAG TPA: ATP-binding protein [Bacteroidota bacterium]|nr:ATP-binding protein [Bacteroidota bacterium]
MVKEMASDWQSPNNLELPKEELKNRLLEAQGFSKKISTLNEISLKIDEASTRDEILAILRAEVSWLIEGECAFISLLNRNKTHYSINTLSRVADALEIDHELFPVDVGMPGWAIQNQTGIFVDVESSPAFNPQLEGRLVEIGIKSLLIVPLRTSTEVIGAIGFGSSKVAAYNQPDMWIAQLLSFHIAMSLRHTALFDSAQRRLSQIELVNRIASRLTSTLDFDKMLEFAAEAIQKNFNYFDVTVFTIDRETHDAVLAAHCGNYVDFLPHGYRQKPGVGIVGWVAMYGERILANDVSLESRYLAYAYHNTNSELALPIKVGTEVVGILNVEDTKLHAFDDTDVLVLSTLCDQLGSAIHNATMYNEIRESNKKLLELDRLKSDFVGIVSHDFRTPLSSIMLAAKSLVKKEIAATNQHVREYLNIIIDQATKLSQLAEDTLTITKMESGQLSYYFKLVNIETLVKEAVSMVKFSNRHQMQYNIELDASFVKGDQSKLRQVLLNLVSNAVKYSPRGGEIEISVVSHSHDEILLTVKDCGIGIPENQLEKLFQKFSRVDSVEVNNIKGSGLGLWISREIIRAHGGKIWVESEVGVGSRFMFTLKKGN